MAILAPDYNPFEVAMYLRKNNPGVYFNLRCIRGKYVIQCDRKLQELRIPKGWKVIENVLTNKKTSKKDKIYYLIYFESSS